MIDNLKQYPAMKDSGVTWLGQVPGHWKVLPNRALFAEVKDRDHPDEEMLSVTITRGIVKQKTLLEGSSKKDSSNLDKSAYKLVQPRDIAYNKMRAWQGAIGASALRGIISPAYVVMRLRNADDLPSYFHHLYRTPQFAKEAERWSYGITSDMWSLRPEHFKMIYTAKPPPDEQAAIVRFLDWANGRLERAIRAKRKVIALLGEQKQVIIHRAVTRGLDPSIPLESSESRWFPELPTGWEALTLRRVITSAVDGPHFSPQYRDVGVPFLSARNVRADRWILSDAKYISETDYIEFSRRVRPEVGDVLYTKGGTTGVARAVDLTFPFQVWVHIAVLKLKRDRIVPEFLAYCLNSPRCYEQAQLFTRGATNQDLGLGRMKDIEVPVPTTLDEQKVIVDFLNSQCSAFNTAISRLEREIELLREYRTRLVADVVTGKLDVREAAARLPDEAPLDSVEDAADLGDEAETADEEAAA
jgi:type I restriction enzyme S subunit